MYWTVRLRTGLAQVLREQEEIEERLERLLKQLDEIQARLEP